jgi:hypothetical protein
MLLLNIQIAHFLLRLPDGIPRHCNCGANPFELSRYPRDGGQVRDSLRWSEEKSGVVCASWSSSQESTLVRSSEQIGGNTEASHIQ